jgi:hypothetical protein
MCFRWVAGGKTVFPCLILLRRLWRGRPWRTPLRRRVRGIPVTAEPLGERPGRHFLSSPRAVPLPTPKLQNPSRRSREEAKARSKDDSPCPVAVATTSSTQRRHQPADLERRGGSGGLSLYPNSERPGLNRDHQPRARGSLLLYPVPMSAVAADPPRSGAFLQGSLSPARSSRVPASFFASCWVCDRL